MFRFYPNYIMINIFLLFFLLISSVFCNEQNTQSQKNNWTKNLNKLTIIENSNTSKIDCPYGIGCECTDDKDCINSNCEKHFRAGYTCTLQNGDTFPHFISKDQFDELVDIYDFAGQDKYILIEMGATWCSPCNLLAGWFAYGEEDIKTKPFWKDEYNRIYDLVKNEEIIFITILYENEFKDTATFDTVYEWYSTYPDELIPILYDGEKLLHKLIKPTGIPAITLVDKNMKILNISTRGFNQSFDKLLELIDNEK